MYTCISYKTTFNESLQVFSQDSSIVDFESVSMVLYCPVHKKKKKKERKLQLIAQYLSIMLLHFLYLILFLVDSALKHISF